jgi:hypothetical protein
VGGDQGREFDEFTSVHSEDWWRRD